MLVYLSGMNQLGRLEQLLGTLDSAVLGYSGGVDSALLGIVASRVLGSRFVAVIGRSASYPEVQYRQAVDIAQQFGIPLAELDTHELEDESYRANAPDRCYHCKQELWVRLSAFAAERGFSSVLDGTNADDLGEHRPGARAGREQRVRSPLAELGWTKLMVRTAGRDLGLPMWDAPAAPCLASRVRYGVEVTPERLAQVEQAERGLRALGVRGNLRVRHLGDGARVEVDPAELPALRATWPAARAAILASGFTDVELDEHGYRRGSLLVLEAGG